MPDRHGNPREVPVDTSLQAAQRLLQRALRSEGLNCGIALLQLLGKTRVALVKLVLEYIIRIPRVLFQLVEARPLSCVELKLPHDANADLTDLTSIQGSANPGSEDMPAQQFEDPGKHEKKVIHNDELMEAIQRSKADAPQVLSSDNVVLLRLTRMARSPEVFSVLMESELLLHCRRRVLEAGCEISPSWASGAKLFVPYTESQLAELDQAGIELRDHHILALRDDKEVISQALKSLPKKKRPGVSSELGAPGDGQKLEENMLSDGHQDDDLVEVVEEWALSTDSSLDFPTYQGAGSSWDTVSP